MFSLAKITSHNLTKFGNSFVFLKFIIVNLCITAVIPHFIISKNITKHVYNLLDKTLLCTRLFCVISKYNSFQNIVKFKITIITKIMHLIKFFIRVPLKNIFPTGPPFKFTYTFFC